MVPAAIRGGGEAVERPLGTVPSPLLLRPAYWDRQDVLSKRKLKLCYNQLPI